jgi:hypothetical protein
MAVRRPARRFERASPAGSRSADLWEVCPRANWEPLRRPDRCAGARFRPCSGRGPIAMAGRTRPEAGVGRRAHRRRRPRHTRHLSCSSARARSPTTTPRKGNGWSGAPAGLAQLQDTAPIPARCPSRSRLVPGRRGSRDRRRPMPTTSSGPLGSSGRSRRASTRRAPRPRGSPPRPRGRSCTTSPGCRPARKS